MTAYSSHDDHDKRNPWFIHGQPGTITKEIVMLELLGTLAQGGLILWGALSVIGMTVVPALHFRDHLRKQKQGNGQQVRGRKSR